MNNRAALTASVVFVIGIFLISGCEDVNHHHDYYPPPVPSGVYTITGDGYVEIRWSPLRIDDLEGYRIYRSLGPAGRYHQIGRSDDNDFLDGRHIPQHG